MHRKSGGQGGGNAMPPSGRPRGGSGGNGGGGNRKDHHGGGGGPRDHDPRELSSHGSGSYHYQHGRGGKKWNGPGNYQQTPHPLSQHTLYMATHQTGQELAHGRVLFVLANVIGNRVEVEVANGIKYHGIYSASPTGKDLSVLLRCAAKLDAKGRPGPIVKSLVVMAKDVRRISCANPEMSVIVKDGNGKEFLADTAISGHTGNVRERNLQKWAPDATSGPAMGLEDARGHSGAWDQFATNEAMFGVTSDFDELMYTTAVDKSDPNFKQREAQAIRLAREIERGPVNNVHMAEERNINVAANEHIDEEDRYSSVIRQPGKYVPPGARRSSVSTKGAESVKETKRPESSAAQLKDQKKPAANLAKDVPSMQKDVAAPKPATPVQEFSQAAPVPKSAHVVPAEQRPAVNKKPALSAAIIKLGQKTAAAGSKNANIEPKNVDAAHVAHAFKEFSTGEKEKLGKKRHEIQKQEKMNMVEDFKTFSSTFKLKTPMPQELREILYKEKGEKASDVSTGKPEAQKEPTDTKIAAAPAGSAKAGPTPTAAQKKPKAEPVPQVKDGKDAKDVKEAALATKSSDSEKAPEVSPAPAVKPKSTFKLNAAAAEFTPSFVSNNNAFAAQKSPMQSERSPHSNSGKRMGGKNQGQYAPKQSYGKGYRPHFEQRPYYHGPQYGGEEAYQPPMDQPHYYPHPNMAPYGYRPMPGGRPFVPGMPAMSMPPMAGYMMPGQFAPGFMPHGQVYAPQFAPPPNGNMRMYPKGQHFGPENGAHYQGQPGVSSPMQAGFMRSPPPMYPPGPMMGGYPPEMLQHYPQHLMMPGPHWTPDQQPLPHPEAPAVVDEPQAQPTPAEE